MIEILNYERVNKNKVIGYVDIILPPMQMPKTIIRRIAHLQNGGKKWFNLPSFSKDSSSGEVKYAKYWQFETEVHNGQMLEKLQDLVNKFCTENKIPEIETLNYKSTRVDFPDDLPF
jgi:hypothetical protein